MLTTKQKQVYDYIVGFESEYGYIPTLDLISKQIKVKSPSTAHAHVKELINKGYLDQDGNYGSLKLASNSRNEVPILGFIAAGQPINVLEDTAPETVQVSNLPSKGKFYALRVKGNSMIDDGILDGDLVIIKKQDYANDGQTVVAIIDDNQATLKQIFRTQKGYKLQPKNQDVLPLFRNEVEIRGIVWEVRRSFSTRQKKSSITKTWKTLDLFAGIGGIRLGFEKADFKTAFANDFEPACKNTYDLNFKDAKLTVADVTKIHADDLPEFDLLLAGFPCQAFSVAGYRKGFEDEKGRGNLFFDIARILKARKPEGFLLENVKNLQSHDKGNTFKVIGETLETLGYSYKAKVLNSMEYGNVPQNRERIYIVGFKDHEKTERFKFPEPIPLTVSVSDLLETKVDEKYYYNGKPLYDRIKDDVNEKNQVYQWRRKYVRRNKKGVCPTLTANMGMGGHNVPIIYNGKGIRKLTPRECARIQGFPDSFKLPDDLADSKLYKQIGNSVSVPVVERIATEIQKVL